MKLIYFPANCAWGFIMGNAMVNLQGYGYLFDTREYAVSAAEYRGLHVAQNGQVSVKE